MKIRKTLIRFLLQLICQWVLGPKIVVIYDRAVFQGLNAALNMPLLKLPHP